METPDRLEIRTDDGNPLREEQRAHIRDEMEARLRARQVRLGGDESDDEVLAVVNAVEAFEGAVMAAGGDLMVDTPESSRPDHARYVLPLRRDDEPASVYAQRVQIAATQLRGG
jgi:hypothetical protein